MEFIKGKWYKGIGGGIIKGWFLKFDCITNDIIKSSEQISPMSGYCVNDGGFGHIGYYKFELLNSMNEIRKYLPKGHIDLKGGYIEIY